MSSLYKKNYIENYDSNAMLDILTGKTSYTPDPYNLKERRVYVTLQHYLIKYIEENGKNKIVNSLLEKYYTDFVNSPQLFVDSPLIKDDFLNRFVPKKAKEKIIECRNKFYSSIDAKNIYIKLIQTNKISELEKNKLYSYLITILRSGNQQLIAKYDELITTCIKRMLDNDQKVKNMNETELKFFCTYVAKHAGGNNVFPEIHIMDISPYISGTENSNIVYINKNCSAMNELYLVTQTVCHEVKHAMQENDAKNKDTKTAFEMAVQKLFTKYLSREDYNEYKLNYRYVGIELDAEEYGFYFSKVLLSSLGRNDLCEKLRDLEKIRIGKRRLYEFMYDVDKKPNYLDACIVTNMDAILKEHPEEIKEFKVLKNLYNEDGTRKSLGNLLARRANQKFEDRGLYDNYVSYEIAKNRLLELDIANTNKELSGKLFRALGNVCRDKALLFQEYCEDNPNCTTIEAKTQIRSTARYQLQIVSNILNFINQNMKYVLDCREDEEISNRSFIYDFIYDFRDFNLNRINNQIIKEDPVIQAKMRVLLNRHRDIVKKFNEQYIKDKIKDLDDNQKNTMIKTPEKVKMTFKEYIYFDLLPRLDAHSTVEVNGKKVHVSNIIKVYVEQIKKKTNNENIK